LLFDPGGIHQRLQRFHTGLVMERARRRNSAGILCFYNKYSADFSDGTIFN
jgi:hypothetical protein